MMSGKISDNDVAECPLCMEPLDFDDHGFYPCPCGYQICRFCWHRLANREDDSESGKGKRGLCPACRQEYPESPVCFNSGITIEAVMEQVKSKKKKKKQANKQKAKQQEEKQKLKEILRKEEKNLTGLRVVQKNLIFVIGIPPRLTQDVLRREFSKYGKIYKLVIGNTNSNMNTAYVTYTRAQDAIRAIQVLNNNNNNNQNPGNKSRANSGRNGSILTVKASLGTTKYCSHFLRNQQCPKLPDCMYLHALADPDASFTKEDMQAGKHTEYEKKLINQYFSLKEKEIDDLHHLHHHKSHHQNNHHHHNSHQIKSKKENSIERSRKNGSGGGGEDEMDRESSSPPTVRVEDEEVEDEEDYEGYEEEEEDEEEDEDEREGKRPNSVGSQSNKNMQLNNLDDLIGNSSDSLSTSYSTCSSGLSISPPNEVQNPQPSLPANQSSNVLLSVGQVNSSRDGKDSMRTNTSAGANHSPAVPSDDEEEEVVDVDDDDDDDDGLDFDPISISTTGLEDLIKNNQGEEHMVHHRTHKQHVQLQPQPQHHHHPDPYHQPRNQYHHEAGLIRKKVELQQQQEQHLWRDTLKALLPNVNITFSNNGGLNDVHGGSGLNGKQQHQPRTQHQLQQQQMNSNRVYQTIYGDNTSPLHGMTNGGGGGGNYVQNNGYLPNLYQNQLMVANGSSSGGGRGRNHNNQMGRFTGHYQKHHPKQHHHQQQEHHQLQRLLQEQQQSGGGGQHCLQTHPIIRQPPPGFANF